MAWIGACSSMGPVRPTNQDACCVRVATSPVGEVALAVVCDGVGGLERGEYASAVVVMNLSRWFDRVLPELLAEAAHADRALGSATVREAWGDLLNRLHEALLTNSGGAATGTTASCVLVVGGRYVVAHVGDTRVYRMSRAGSISQVSEDQTLDNQRVAEGEITFDEANTSNQGHVITQAIGASPSVRPVFYGGRLRGEELLVVCTDGVWRLMGEEGIQDAFDVANWHDDESLGDTCAQLVRDAIGRGETDNLTVACLCVGEGREGKPSGRQASASHERPAPPAGDFLTQVDVSDDASREGGER